MDDFEQFLKRQSTRTLPQEWRAEILEAAIAARQQQAEPAVEQPTPSSAPWWLAWLWPSPLAWAGVACTWILIFGLEAASRPAATDARLADASVSSQEAFAIFAENQKLLQQFCLRLEHVDDAPAAPPEPATDPRRREGGGACNWRNSNRQVA